MSFGKHNPTGVLWIAGVACAGNGTYQSGEGVLDADATDHLASVQVLRQDALASGPARGLNDQRVPQRYLDSPRCIDRSEHQGRINGNHVELRDPAYCAGRALLAERALSLRVVTT
jgi:hypothetical protein